VSLVQRLRDDLNQSLKKGDKERVSALRLVLADINNAEIAKGGPLDEAGLLGVVSKRVKLYRESIDAFRKGSRQDLWPKRKRSLLLYWSIYPNLCQPRRSPLLLARRLKRWGQRALAIRVK
jgi:uncharacterized protein YqeY